MKLRSGGLIEDTEEYDINGNVSICVKTTSSGSSWIAENSKRITELLDAMRKPAPAQVVSFDEDIPF